MILYKKYKDNIEKYKRKNKIFCRSNKKVLEDICIIDINNDSINFTSINKKHWTEKIIIYALSRNGHNLVYVDKDIQTLDMALMAILTSKKKEIIEYVNKKFINQIWEKLSKTKYRSIGKWELDDKPMSKKRQFYYLRRKIFKKYCYGVKKRYKKYY